MKEKVEQYFDSYPDADELYLTSDGQAFLERPKADTHAARLKDGKVRTFTRNGETNVQDETEAVEALLALDLAADPTSLDYKMLLHLKESLGLESKGNKKPELIEALYAKQEELNQAKDEA